jgi:TfoX/Sxy family transcriptional regulator of competence genes
MAYNEHFAELIRAALGDRTIIEKKMFGGVGFMVNGHLTCGIHREQLMLRVSAEETDALLERPGARPFKMRGRVLKRWVLVAPETLSTEAALKKWVSVALRHTETLPDKAGK